MFCDVQADAIHKMGEQIGTKLAKAEELGQQGNVDESLKLLEEVEELKKAKQVAEVSMLSTRLRHQGLDF